MLLDHRSVSILVEQPADPVEASRRSWRPGGSPATMAYRRAHRALDEGARVLTVDILKEGEVGVLGGLDPQSSGWCGAPRNSPRSGWRSPGRIPASAPPDPPCRGARPGCCRALDSRSTPAGTGALIELRATGGLVKLPVRLGQRTDRLVVRSECSLRVRKAVGSRQLIIIGQLRVEVLVRLPQRGDARRAIFIGIGAVLARRSPAG